VIEDRVLAGDLEFLDEERLLEFVEAQRWFGSKAQEIAHARLLDTAVLRTTSPLLVAGLLEIRFQPGTHDLYQLLLGFRPSADGWDAGVIDRVDGWMVYDAFADATLTRELVYLMRSDNTLPSQEGRLEFKPVALNAFGPSLAEPRSVGVEQSNSSVVYGDELILKAYRRLEAGINPELELLRFLTVREFPNIAALAGWYAYSGFMDSTLGVLQQYVAEAVDGWELALEELGQRPAAFLDRLRRLGEVTGDLHTALASDSSDPEFAPEEPSAESLAILTATVDEEIEAVFVDLPETEALEPIAGRGEEVRERLRVISSMGSVGRVIRTHGDFHLGQVLWTGEDWILLDFEGEPARSLPERRRKRSPLRDVAGMLRSFAYAASAAEVSQGVRVPADWETRAREQFLDGYFERVDRSVVPPGQDATEKLLAVFELEKAVYELRYELNNRPEWVKIPVRGILRLLESDL
jgi:maltokinase